MSLIDRGRLRDMQGRSVAVGHTVHVYRRPVTGDPVFKFTGAVAQVRPTAREGRLEALVQPHGDEPAEWVGGLLLALPDPWEPMLEGRLAEWSAE